MGDPGPDAAGPEAAAIEAVRREFVAGLPARLAVLRSALAELVRGYTRPAAETFYYRAHALKGTAASFGADELVSPATALAQAGRRWLETGALAPGTAVATRELERLAAAIERYRARAARTEAP